MVVEAEACFHPPAMRYPAPSKIAGSPRNYIGRVRFSCPLGPWAHTPSAQRPHFKGKLGNFWDPKLEPKMPPKLEPKTGPPTSIILRGPKMEPKLGPKLEPKFGPKLEPKMDQKWTQIWPKFCNFGAGSGAESGALAAPWSPSVWRLGIAALAVEWWFVCAPAPAQHALLRASLLPIFPRRCGSEDTWRRGTK